MVDHDYFFEEGVGPEGAAVNRLLSQWSFLPTRVSLRVLILDRFQKFESLISGVRRTRFPNAYASSA